MIVNTESINGRVIKNDQVSAEIRAILARNPKPKLENDGSGWPNPASAVEISEEARTMQTASTRTGNPRVPDDYWSSIDTSNMPELDFNDGRAEALVNPGGVSGLLNKRKESLDAEMSGPNALSKLSANDKNAISAAYESELFGVMSPFSNSPINVQGELDSLTKKYGELYDGIKAEYSGEDFDDRIKLLDDAFDKSVSSVASWQSLQINSAAMRRDGREKAGKGAEQIVSMRGDGDPSSEISKMYNGVKELNENIEKSISQYGNNVKAFIKSGGNLTDKSGFDAYMNQNAGVYSISEMKLISSALSVSASGNTTNGGVLKQISDSGLPENVKKALDYIAGK
jgi:hypothetical protein